MSFILHAGPFDTFCPPVHNKITTRMADNVTSQRMAGPFLNGANLRLFPWGGQFHFCSSVFSLGRRRAAWYSIVEDGPMVHALYRTAAMIQTLAYSSNSFQPVGNNLDGLNRNQLIGHKFMENQMCTSLPLDSGSLQHDVHGGSFKQQRAQEVISQELVP